MQKKTIETLNKVAETTLEQPMIITVDLIHGGWFQKLIQRLGLRPKQRVFEVKPITLGNLIRISQILLKIDEHILDQKNILPSIYQALSKHGSDLAEVVAIAVINTKAGPSQAVINMVREEFTPDELARTLSMIITRMNVSDFMQSIILIRGLNVLESEQKKEPKKKVSP